MEALSPEDVAGAFASVILPFRAAGRIALDLRRIDKAALEAQLAALVEAGVAGFFAADASGELAALSPGERFRVHSTLMEAAGDAGLPAVLDAVAEDLDGALARIAAGASLEPPAWSVSPAAFEDEDRVLAELAALARAAAPASLVLEEPRAGAFDAALLARWSHAVPQIVGARVLPRDGERWAGLARVTEDLALFAAGREWASAARWGARSSSSELVALWPPAAALFAELLENDVQHALRLERRFQHFLEAAALPLLRRAPAAELERLLARAGGWCPNIDSDQDVDIETLRDAFELFRDAFDA